MHVYSINNDIRKRVIIGLFVISILFSILLREILQAPIELIVMCIRKVKLIDMLFQWCDFFGVSYDVLSVSVLYSFLFWIFDRKVWKVKCINKWLDIPNLNGTWKGKAISSIDKNKEYSIEMKIEQTWSKICFVSIFPDTNSKSESNCAAFFVETNGDKKVGFAFENKSRDVELQQYEGYNILEIDSDNIISGRYFNNRDNRIMGNKGGNKGTFKIARSESNT